MRVLHLPHPVHPAQAPDVAHRFQPPGAPWRSLVQATTRLCPAPARRRAAERLLHLITVVAGH